MEDRSASGVLAPSATFSYRGSSTPSIPNYGALASETSLPHAPARMGENGLSLSGSLSPCGASVPLPTATAMATPFVWDPDSPAQQSNTHALVSPVLLAGKKKGGLLSGLKKMFHSSSSSKGPDGRAATGAGAQQLAALASKRGGGGGNGSLTSSDGTAGGCALDPSVSGHAGSKMERSVKSPTCLRVQASSSRDLTLAALLTSPVRLPGAPGISSSGGGGGGALGSPAVLSSPMPSMRPEHAPSASASNHNLNLAITDGEVLYGSGGGGGESRLFPTSRNGGGVGTKPLGSPAGAGAQSTGQLLYGNPAALSPCHSSHQLPFGTKSTAATALQQHYSLQKSCSAALASSGSLASCFTRGDSFLTDDPSSSQSTAFYSQRVAAAAATSGGGSGSGAGRVLLPQISSPRSQQDCSTHSVSGGISPSASGGGGGGRSGAASPMPAPPAEEDGAGAYGGDGGGEEEDEMPGSMLLGMNPAVPAAMRRRRWSLDDYQVIKRMYKGGTSAVYRATCLRSGITVALKVYFLSKVPINVVHMIRREIELHVPLVHRNIISLYAAFQDEKHIVLVEEYAARGDLFGIHRSMNCRLTETQTSELILAPFLDALSYLHARGIMHRDIKPENILFTHEWTLKIADFGVSINVQEERAVTRTGTADYMAPEVERCPLKHAPEDNKNNPSLAYTPAIDVWSVGVLAYEMLVGFPPFVSNGNGEDGAGGGGGAPGSAGGARHGGGGAGGGGGMAAFMAEQATRKTLRFPASVSAAAKDFIMATLNENPGDRPTAQQLLKHPWLFKAARRMSTNSTSRLSNANLVAAQY